MEATPELVQEAQGLYDRWYEECQEWDGVSSYPPMPIRLAELLDGPLNSIVAAERAAEAQRDKEEAEKARIEAIRREKIDRDRQRTQTPRQARPIASAAKITASKEALMFWLPRVEIPPALKPDEEWLQSLRCMKYFRMGHAPVSPSSMHTFNLYDVDCFTDA